MQDERKLKDLLHIFLRDNGLSDKMDEMTIAQSWGEIVGYAIAQKTEKVYIKHDSLHIYLNSAALKNELRFHKEIIVDKVNQYMGKSIIKNIEIR